MNGSVYITSMVIYLFCLLLMKDVECYLVYKGESNPPCKELDRLRVDEYRACKGYLLIIAIMKGKLKGAKRLLEDESDAPYVVAFKDKSESTYGYNALIWAAKKNYSDLVKLLIQKNAKVNHASGANYTALYYTVKNQNKECTALLLTKGADPNIYPRGGNSPLLYAALYDHYDMAKLLLDNEADPNSMTEGSNYFPLYFASKAGNSRMVNELLKRKALVDLQTSWNVTALLAATAYGHRTVVETLLNSNANPNLKDNLDMTPLHKAAYYGHLDILGLLLSKRAKINALDVDFRTALHHGSRKGQKDIVRNLLKYCPDDKIRNIYDQTALEEARSKVEALQRRQRYKFSSCRG